MHPSSGLTKEYSVTLSRKPSQGELEAIAAGCTMDGVFVQPLAVGRDDSDATKPTRVRIVVAEGRNREVRLVAWWRTPEHCATCCFGCLQCGLCCSEPRCDYRCRPHVSSRLSPCLNPPPASRAPCTSASLRSSSRMRCGACSTSAPTGRSSGQQCHQTVFNIVI